MASLAWGLGKLLNCGKPREYPVNTSCEGRGEVFSEAGRGPSHKVLTKRASPAAGLPCAYATAPSVLCLPYCGCKQV